MQQVDWKQARERLVENELRMLGIRDEAVLHAMRIVPREEFLSEELREFAYRNVPLPIGSGQTISQPLIVAYMAEALELTPHDRVLEIGAGSGYAAAVLSLVAREVFTIERHAPLADECRARLQRLGYANVEVRCADGTQGWPEEAPFDAIVVAAGGPQVPQTLLDQLEIGGRLVMPVGKERDSQHLIRVVRRGKEQFEYEELTAVRFVPLIGAEGWEEERAPAPSPALAETARPRPGIPELIRRVAEPIASVDSPDLDSLLRRIGNARVVLIGEATHGTSEFYRLRAAISRGLIERAGFQFVAVEADWPDAYRIHDFVTHRERGEPHDWEAFARFPTWMWRNQEVLDFIHWMRDFNLQRALPQRVGFFGLDLYSLFTSVDRVLDYLDQVDPATAAIARMRYGCLTPWESDPSSYGRATVSGRYRSCETDVAKMLSEMLGRRVEQGIRDGEELFNAQVNARLVANAEQYYRIMYYGSDESWNHRDTHMFETLQSLLARYGSESRGIVWAHNSHLGNAAATQFGKHGQLNLGQLCREAWGDALYAIGQGTDHGTVAAALCWEGPMQIQRVRPALPGSYEHLMHLTEQSAFFLPLTHSPKPSLTSALAARRLQRAIGVVYRPDTERMSHYFDASLSEQFDEWIWIDETSAVRALSTEQRAGHEPHHPFAVIDT